jgi:hypothetical protein
LGDEVSRPSAAAAARRIEREIAELTRRLHREMFGSEPLPRGPLPVELDLKLDLEDGRCARDGESLLTQVSRAVQRAGSPAEPGVPGRVYCFRCGSPRCEHSAPEDPKSVFAGFTATGQPQWRNLGQLLLDLKDDRVEALFSEPAGTLARVQLGRELKQRQLHPFGRASKTYDLLGQVVAGYFGSPAVGRDALFAVTAQAVESRRPDGTARLWLNVIARAPAGEGVRDLLAGPGAEPYRREVSRARLRLESLGRDVARDPSRRAELMHRVPGILHDLRRAVERGGRQEPRRTRHAVERRRDNRPTAAALRDAWEAPDAQILADPVRGTLIVPGPRGRAHAFSRDGRHVTSLRLSGDEYERRLETSRWRPATAAEVEQLRRALPPAPPESG